MFCFACSDPMPTIQWDKDLKYINATHWPRFHVLENGTLHIEEINLDDEGRYGCTIGNSAGLKRQEVQLRVRGIMMGNGISICRFLIYDFLSHSC